MGISDNKKGEILNHERGSQEQLSFILIFIITFLVLIFPATNSQASSGTILRIIYGGNLLGTIKPCG